MTDSMEQDEMSHFYSRIKRTNLERWRPRWTPKTVGLQRLGNSDKMYISLLLRVWRQR
jgi:hypothetical protein